MKKYLVLSMLISMSAFAGDFKYGANVSSGLGLLGKVDQVPGIVDIRKANPFLDLSADVTHKSGLGLEAKFLYLPGSVKLINVIDADETITSYTAGPKFTKNLGKVDLFGAVGLGLYHTTDSLRVAGVTISESTNSFGFNVETGVDYNVYKSLYLGGKATFHYIADTGEKDDATIFAIGPSLGVKF